MTEPQREKAILRFSKTGNDILTEAWRDSVVLDYAGIPLEALAAAQRQQGLDPIEPYAGNMDERHARVKMAKVAHDGFANRSLGRRDVGAHRTWFAWIGGTRGRRAARSRRLPCHRVTREGRRRWPSFRNELRPLVAVTWPNVRTLGAQGRGRVIVTTDVAPWNDETAAHARVADARMRSTP